VNPYVWEGAAQAYEALRCDLLQPSRQNGCGNGRAILLRRGLMAWTCERDNAILPTPTPPSASESQVPSEVASELIRLMAGLILSRRKECCHA
jgi:hypothetical protein